MREEIVRIAACLGLWLVMLAAAFAQVDAGRMRLAFSETDVAHVLKAVSVRTGASIVYAHRTPVPVTLDVTVETVEEALRSAVSAAGLSYRKIGSTYVVASADGMRQALEPFATKVHFTPTRISPEDVVRMFTENLPHAAARQVGGRVALTAVMEDIRAAQMLFRDAEARADETPSAQEFLTVRHMNSQQVSRLLEAVSPMIRSAVVAEIPGATVVRVSGPESAMVQARELIAKLDVQQERPVGADLVFRVYSLKYASGPTVVTFLEKAAPGVEAVLGPEAYAPPRPQFNPLGGGAIGAGVGSQQGGGGAQRSSGGFGAGGGAGLGGGFGAGSTVEGENARTVVLRGPEPLVSAAIRLLEELDVRPVQVMVEVRVVETSPTFSEQVGFNWSWTRFGFYEVPPGTVVDRESGSAALPTRPLGWGQLSRVPFSFQTFLNAQISRGEAKLIASPSLTMLDNTESNIFIGDTIRARIAQATGLGGQTVEIVEFPVGIILLLRPRVNADGDITLRVNPVVSTVTAVDQNNIPQTSAREADTTVIVRDGETIVIGGMIRDEHSRVIQEVPFLSKLPIVGELFRNRSTSRRRTDVLVTITPRIVREGMGAPSASGPVNPPPSANGGNRP
jgi:type II secretory pathway component GspD/PulD (secretin)